MAKSLQASQKSTSSTSHKDFVTILGKRLDIDPTFLARSILESMTDCFTFEPGFSCRYKTKTNKKCYKKATNKEQTYCSLHVRYAGNTTIIVDGKPCSYIFQSGPKKKGTQCNKIGKQADDGKYYCDGHFTSSTRKEPPILQKGNKLNHKVTLDPSVVLVDKGEGVTVISNTTYECEC